ncbi:MAG TPA: hypothetical protein VFD48_02560 [Pyrinomonadaceae bacterium]|nr:hypothetical protein [Pyrinomonadaceae bacterium]
MDKYNSTCLIRDGKGMGEETGNLYFPLVAATFEKANTYVLPGA